ncbi:DNA gyrase subunit A [Desulfonauticus submarinus]|uniref:DNA gyrase subunit A n=1 Tax=Desulfonauticus submarinus TaxID=206665 RepID=A0A1H0DWF2_9BACT|nr:DNA gyrase subunit A [Desulfonauticus submarinus]
MINYINIEDELKKSYLEYSLSVIVGRALPDVRDGLKPVHRRILYAMHELGNTYNKPFKKSARIVGDVIGKYHPHGDAAVYDALVRMAQNFNMREPLIEGQGNFGSIDGDSAAAMRYTEVRLAKITSEFLTDIDKDTVDFRPNYDNTLKEPEVLPTKIPNLIINGSSGIAVGMATNIPPHNLKEVIEATLYLLDNPNCCVSDLMNFIKGPDFPTGAFVYGQEGLKSAYETGRGSIKIRSKIEIEEGKNKSIVIKEIPYAVNKSNLVEKIAQLINENKIEGIADLRDESDRNGIRIVIELKKGVYEDIIINKLYKFSGLEQSYGINIMAVVNNRPKLLTLKEVLECFLEHRRVVVLRRTKFELNKAEARAHILEGLKKALDIIDEIIKTIKQSKTPSEAKKNLIRNYDFSEIQAQAILDMKLQRLTNLEKQKLIEEYNELIKTIEYLNSILNNKEVLKTVIKEELIKIKQDYSSERKTIILDYDPDNINVEDIIPDSEVVVTLTKNGYIKRTSLSNYNQQKRGGKGIVGANVSKNDFVIDLVTTSNHQDLYLFSNQGKCYKIKVYDIPEASRIAKGIHIKNIIPLAQEEFIAKLVSQRNLTINDYFFFVTKRGLVKKTSTSLFKNIRQTGIIAINLKDGDELIDVKLIHHDSEIMLITKSGYCIRFNTNEIRPIGRNAMGVKGVALREGDKVVSAVEINGDDRKELLTISEKGFGKRTSLDMYRVQSRGGKGIKNMKVNNKTGSVCGSVLVNEKDEIIILNSLNKIIRIGVKDIRKAGRDTMGVKLINIEDGQRIVCFDRVIKEENL